MLSQHQYMTKLQKERRQFAIHNQQLERSQKLQKQKADQLEEEVKEKDKLITEKERKIQQLEDELEQARLTIKTYKQMLFDKHKQTEIEEENQGKEQNEGKESQTTKKKNGQKTGHIGYGRKKPETIDQQTRCFVTVCPDCGNPVNRSANVHSHTVIDIPHWKEMKPLTTEYKIEYQ